MRSRLMQRIPAIFRQSSIEDFSSLGVSGVAVEMAIVTFKRALHVTGQECILLHVTFPGN